MDDLRPAQRVEKSMTVSLFLALALYPLGEFDQLAGVAHLLELLQEFAHVGVRNAGEVGLLGLDGGRSGLEAFGGCEELGAEEGVVGLGLVGNEGLGLKRLKIL